MPGRPRGFLNRADELEEFDAVLAAAAAEEQPALELITGLVGIGKTTFAVQLAYRVLTNYPDGQLYYNLGGSAATGPTTPSEVLRYFLLRLGVAENDIPVDEEDRAAVFRSVTAHRRLLLLLDDAASMKQLLPLLPSSPHSAVLVTSRRRLSAARRHGFHSIELRPFLDDVAAAMISRALSRALLPAEVAARDRLVTLCAGVPLALSLVLGAWDERRHPLSAVVEKLLACRRVSALADDTTPSIEAVLDLAYLELPAPHARAYRLLSRHTGPEFGLPAAAALLDVAEADVSLVLDALVEANLLLPLAQDRYRFHDFVILHAHDRAVSDESKDECDAAVRRVVAWYTRRAVRLTRAAYRRWWSSPLFDEAEPVPAGTDVLAELEVERVNLMAAVHAGEQLGTDDDVAPLCEALGPWYYNTDRVDDLVHTQQVGVAAATRAGDRAVLMRLHNQLGTAYELQGRLPEALTEFRRSQELATSIGHVLGEQSAVEWTGIVLGAQGEVEPAVRALRESQRVAERVADPEQRERAIALGRMHIDRLLGAAGQRAGFTELKEVLAYFHHSAEPVNEARTLLTLAAAYLRAAEPRLARPPAERAVALFGGAGFVSQQASALRLLADVEERLGEPEAAEAHRREADALTTPGP